jgi:AcrR family transcriptional regulator
METKEKLSISRRQQIHSAALICFARKGYHQATMDDIVAESGLSKGTLYWYFPSKKELFLSLLDETMGQYVAYWQMVGDQQDLGAVQKLESILSLFRTEMDQMSSIVDLILEVWALLRHDDDIAGRFVDYYLPSIDLIADIIAGGVEKGVFEVDSPKEAAMVVMSLFDGLLLAMSTGLAIGEWHRIHETAVKMVLKALGMKDE